MCFDELFEVDRARGSFGHAPQCFGLRPRTASIEDRAALDWLTQADFVLPGGDLTRLAALMKDAESALPDRRTAETWENVRECIWMSSSCAPLEARLAPTRAATALALAEIPP